jgi:hypothetical protein
MSILVTCPGCKTQLKVSEKFAGKTGPCPKCKAPIAIPKVDPAVAAAAAAPPPVADVKIHAPDAPAQPGKTATAAATLKPLRRKDARITPRLAATVLAAIVGLFISAWLGGRFVQSPFPLTTAEESNPTLVAERRMQTVTAYSLRTLGLLLIGWPIVIAGYAVLRDDELEPFRGRPFLLRIVICLVVYIGVWGLYASIPNDLKSEAIWWVFFAPLLIAPAAVAAYYCFDLDPLGSVIHACFFLLTTLALGWTAGLDMPWSGPRLPPPPSPAAPGTKIQIIYEPS